MTDPDLYPCEHCGRLMDDDMDCDCQDSVHSFPGGIDEDDESERHPHPDFAR